jgi:hypothetical protein
VSSQKYRRLSLAIKGGIGQPFYIAHVERSVVIVARLVLAALVGQRRAKWVTHVPPSPTLSISGSNLSEGHTFCTTMETLSYRFHL